MYLKPTSAHFFIYKNIPFIGTIFNADEIRFIQGIKQLPSVFTQSMSDSTMLSDRYVPDISSRNVSKLYIHS